jgi:hypothetical protein
MEKFKLLLERAQQLNDAGQVNEASLIPTVDNVVNVAGKVIGGIGNKIKRRFGYGSNTTQPQTQTQQTQQQTQQQSGNNVQVPFKSNNNGIFYKLIHNDNKFQQVELYLQYDPRSGSVTIIDENTFKRA